MVKLFEHQKEAIYKMKNGCILCGGVGTGKSTTSLAYYIMRGGDGCYTKDDRYIEPTFLKQLIIITTAKKRDSKEWDNDLSRFGLSRDITKTICKMAPIVDSWNNIKKYVNFYNCFFIFDEQCLTGYGAWVKTFFKIAKKNRWIVLSATPGDTWMDYLPIFIANGYFKSKSDFMFKHVRLDPRVKTYPKIIGYFNEEVLEQYRKEVLVLMLYEKAAISHHIDIIVPYDDEKYKLVWESRKNPYKLDPNTGAPRPIEQVAELYSTVRRVVNEDQRRVDAVKDLCLRKGRTIIFYNFNYELELLRKMCEEMDMTYSEWNGHKHEPIADTRDWVYLVQYKSGDKGWECIITNVVIFFSQSYSYKETLQASGRIDRLTTPFTDLYFFHIKSRSPIDYRISKALSRKEDFNELDDYKEQEEEDDEEI